MSQCVPLRVAWETKDGRAPLSVIKLVCTAVRRYNESRS